MNKITKKQDEDKAVFAFDKENYILMAIGFAVIVLGYILMSGGKSEDPSVFSDAIFSKRRIVIAPIFIVIGFAIEVYAIFKKSKSTAVEQDEN